MMRDNDNVLIDDVRSGRLKPIDKFIGMQLRKERKKRRMSLTDVSENLGISYQQLQKYEQAKSRVSVSTLYALAELYGLEISNFFLAIGNELSAYDGRYRVNCGTEMRDINILVAEPDPADEALIRCAMEDIESLNVLFVHDGVQSLEVLKYKTLCPNFPKPNVVFMDPFIAKRDGLSVLKELKRDDSTKEIPVVMLTNVIDSELVERAYKFGVSGYILKTQNQDVFKESITDCIKYWTKTVVAPIARV